MSLRHRNTDTIIHCAFRRSRDGLVFMPLIAAPKKHPMFCELRVRFRDWGVIASVEIRSYGTDFAADVLERSQFRAWRWRHLDEEALEAATRFLALNYASAMEAA